MKIVINKDLIKSLYLDEGFNASEIAKKLDLKVDSVKKCIQRNFSENKLDHKRARFQKKEIEKVINYEATKCMSDSEFIKKNKSIYKTKNNGDIVINVPEETLSWDVPKKLSNDNNKELIEKRWSRQYKKNKNQENNPFN